jgi:hypothetical protein
MKSFARCFLVLVTVAAPEFVASPALAQEATPGEVAQPSTDEEDRWAAEREPSQLEPVKKEEQASDPLNIPADVVVGLRTGYGLAGGKIAESGSDLMKVVAGQVPIQLEFGALLDSGFYIGVYGQYGFGFLGSTLADACDEAERAYPGTDVSCRTWNIRAGLAFEYHPGARKEHKPSHPSRRGNAPSQINPWFGLGTGFEYLAWKVAASDGSSAATATQSVSGFEFVSGHFGADLALADWFALGPFLTATLGSYGTADASCEGDCEGFVAASGPIADTSFHMWAFFGVRARARIEGP